MTNRIQVTDADVMPLDGECFVQAYDADGREYTLLRPLTPGAALALAGKVRAAGSIDPALWDCRAPYGTAAWLADGMEERTIEDERYGFL